MKKFLSVVMLVLFTMTAFAQNEFQKVYTEAYLKKGDAPAKAFNVQTTITYNVGSEKAINVSFNGKNYLYKLASDSKKGFSEEYGAYQAVYLTNGNKTFMLIVYNDEKYGVILASGDTIMAFR